MCVVLSFPNGAIESSTLLRMAELAPSIATRIRPSACTYTIFSLLTASCSCNRTIQTVCFVSECVRWKLLCPLIRCTEQQKGAERGGHRSENRTVVNAVCVWQLCLTRLHDLPSWASSAVVGCEICGNALVRQIWRCRVCLPTRTSHHAIMFCSRCTERVHSYFPTIADIRPHALNQHRHLHRKRCR